MAKSGTTRPVSGRDSAAEAGTITTSQAARLLMVSDERVRQLTKAGFVPKAARGRYNLVALVQGYIRFLKDDERRSSKSAADSRVRDARAAEIERRMAREDRKIIALDEAMAAFDQATGLYLQSLSSLPARITRNSAERRRIEAVCDAERQRLSDRFAQSAVTLQTGSHQQETADVA